MMLDNELILSDAQVVTATGSSTNYIDPLAAKSWGAGNELEVFCLIGAVTGTSPTLTIAIQVADDAAFSTNLTTIATATPTLTSGATYGRLRLALPANYPRRYCRAYYTVGGTSPSIPITLGFCGDEQAEQTRTV